MRTSARLLGATAVAAMALMGAAPAALAGGDPLVGSESGDGGEGGSGGIGVNLLCGIGVLGTGKCDAANGGAGGASSSETGIGNEG